MHELKQIRKKILEDEEIRIRKLLRDDFEHYAKECLRIRTKNGDVDPFIFNTAQKFIHLKLTKQLNETGRVRALILKGRQQGCSTYVGGRFYHNTTHNFGIQTFILTHMGYATDNLFKLVQRFYQNTPDVVKPSVTTNNSKELIFGKLDSGYKIGTAENKKVGRSSTIQLFHGSEVAFWENAREHATGILQAVPDLDKTEIILESTANGVGNYFHQQWQQAEAGQSDYIAIFVPWFWQDEYRKDLPEDFEITIEEDELKRQYNLTDEQICWRRYKIINLSISGQDGAKVFCQEYPCNAAEAFQMTGEDSYIESAIVIKARKTIAERYGPKILSCDPAYMGDDRSSVIFRQGRVAFDKQSFVKKNTMEMVGIIAMLIVSHTPDVVVIDVGGIGAGIVDRLKELYPTHGFIVGINSGSSPYDAKKYLNKRAEMWGLTKLWLLDEPCQIPDEDSLQADLCGIKYDVDSNSRLVMEGKKQMKKRGIRSPDEADALCLTFALPFHKFEKITKEDDVVQKAIDVMNRRNAAQQNSWS